MATIRINALPEAVTPVATQNVAIDGATTARTTIQALVDTGAPVPSEAEARAGTDNSKRMTALRVKQSIDEEIGTTLAGAMQKSQNLNDVADKGTSRFNLKIPVYAADRAALKALDTTKDVLAYLVEGGRAGAFQWQTGDFTTRHAGDTQEGVWIKANAVASSEGSWERVEKQQLDFRWFGGDADPAAENKPIVQAAFNVSSGYVYSGFRAPLVVRETYMATGGMYTRSNLHVIGRNGGGFKAKAGGYSGTGAFITNVSTVPSERAVDNVWFDGVVIDLSLITYVGNTTNSENCLGFARGATNVKVTNCLLKGAAPNFNIASGGVGGKGLNFDGGVRGAIVYGNRFEGCYQGWSLRGNEAEFSAGDGKEQVSKIIGFGNHFEDNMVGLALNGRDPLEDPDMDPADMMIEIYASTYHNCGFCPDFKAGNANRYKSGIIMAGEAQNVLIDGFRGYNDPDYIDQKGGWPATGTVIGQGLSGNIGAILYGWGANCQFRNIVHNGDVDQLVVLGRAYAIGDDARAEGLPTNLQIVCNKFDVDIHHVGTCINLVRQDIYDTVISSGNATGHWRIRYDIVSGNLIAGNAGGLVGHVLEILQDNAGGRKATGSFKWFSDNYTTSLAGSQSQKVGFESIKTGGIANTGTIANTGNMTNSGSLTTGSISNTGSLTTAGVSNSGTMNIGGGSAVMSKLFVLSASATFGNVVAHTVVSQTFTVTGATTGAGRFVVVTATGTNPSGIVFTGQVTAANTVTIFATNTTAADINVTIRTFGIMVIEAA